jgi:hypothetical protein
MVAISCSRLQLISSINFCATASECATPLNTGCDGKARHGQDGRWHHISAATTRTLFDVALIASAALTNAILTIRLASPAYVQGSSALSSASGRQHYRSRAGPDPICQLARRGSALTARSSD